MRTILLLVLVLCGFGCTGLSASTPPGTDTANMITVEGRVSVRGNMPNTALILETEQRTLYVLVLGEADAAAWEPNLPAHLRVTGHLYADDWNGLRYAHLRATDVQGR